MIKEKTGLIVHTDLS